MIALRFSNHMKIYNCLLFLFVTFLSHAQGEINGPAPIIDTMRTDFQGDWYLSGVTYYSGDETNSSALYEPVNDKFHIRITKDSLIFFSPPQRFYRAAPAGYKYEMTDFHSYHGSEIVTYLETKKNRLDIAKFTIKYNGKELRLIESLKSKSYGEVGIESCSIYKPFVDSVHLEQKLLGAWQQGRLDYSKIADKKLQLKDTITLYKSSCKEQFTNGIQFFFEFKDGSLIGEIDQSYYTSSNEGKSSTSPTQGIIDGIYIKGYKCICSVFPGTSILMMKNENIQYTFSIISCTEDQLIMVLLNQETKTPNKWR